MKNCILVFLICTSLNLLASASIEDTIHKYFTGDIVAKFYSVWENYRKGYENAVENALKEVYGTQAGDLNIYVKRVFNPQILELGFYFTDNIVSVLLRRMSLRRLPRLVSPDVSLSLQDNVIKFESPLTKMFIDCDYVMLRNRSDLVFEGGLNLTKASPFALQQVQTRGQLTIVAEDCHLVGFSFAILAGLYVHTSRNDFKVVNCKFTVEITEMEDAPVPPVIAPYFNKEQCLQLESMLSKPTVKEMAPTLQGALISIVNSTSIFGKEMFKIRGLQKFVVEETAQFMRSVVNQLKKLFISLTEQARGSVKMDNMNIAWDDKLKDDSGDLHKFNLSNVTLNGLDLIYSGHRGGPLKMNGYKITEELRFGLLQVRGNLLYNNSTTEGVHLFIAEIKDVFVNVLLNLATPGKDGAGGGGKGDDELICHKKGEKPIGRSGSGHTFEVSGWRSLEFIFAGSPRSRSLIAGYLYNEIPKVIIENLQQLFDQAIRKAADDIPGVIANTIAGENDGGDTGPKLNDHTRNERRTRKALYITRTTGRQSGKHALANRTRRPGSI